MTFAVCIHKYIPNVCIETNLYCTQAVFDGVRNKQLYHNSFIYERYIKITFSFTARTRKTREHSAGINDKI